MTGIYSPVAHKLTWKPCSHLHVGESKTDETQPLQ